MIRENFYTGEPEQGSPPIGFSNMSNMTFTDPNERMANLQRQINMPFQYQPTNPFQPVQQPIGYMGYNQTQGFQGYQGNPALQMLAQRNGQPFYGYGFGGNPYFQQPQYQDRTVHVPGFNPSQDTLFDRDIEMEAIKLQNQMIDELERADYERRQRIQGYFNNQGMNYYGSPFMASYADPNIIQKYRNIANQIRQEGVERRMNFNKKLSRLVHNFLKDNTSEEDINKIYEGYSYVQKGIEIQEDARQAELKRMVPVNNQFMYQNHYAMVHNTIKSLMGDPKNMNDFFEAQGVLRVAENLENEMHERRNLTNMYSRDIFRKRIAQAKLERGDQENTNFPVLSNAAQMLDDGTMVLQAPNFFGLNNNVDRQVVINNQLEAHYEENRRRFIESIYQEGALNYGRQK